jgi:hypothetical protein
VFPRPKFCLPDVAEHVNYEFVMFEYLFGKLEPLSHEYELRDPGHIEPRVGTGCASTEQMEVSTLLEAFLLHARVLRDFFFYKGKYKDNVLAGDFVDDWGTRDRSECDYLGSEEVKDRMDKALAHLAKKRVEYKANGEKWDIAKINLEIQATVSEFRKRLTPERQLWFEKR